MKKYLIFGNSGSGKSTLAKHIADTEHAAHLDLDTLAWQPGCPPERAPLAQSKHHIDAFIASNKSWVIEGCYADLLALAVPQATEMIYLDLLTPLCIENARARPWEPHKYPSKAAQDANLDMLIDWIGQYDQRQDCFSRSAHDTLFRRFTGGKRRYVSNERED